MSKDGNKRFLQGMITFGDVFWLLLLGMEGGREGGREGWREWRTEGREGGIKSHSKTGRTF